MVEARSGSIQVESKLADNGDRGTPAHKIVLGSTGRMTATQLAKSKCQQGFTIIEVLFAMLILLIGVLATVTLLNTASASSQTTQARNQATSVARNVIEVARAIK